MPKWRKTAWAKICCSRANGRKEISENDDFPCCFIEASILKTIGTGHSFEYFAEISMDSLISNVNGLFGEAFWIQLYIRLNEWVEEE